MPTMWDRGAANSSEQSKPFICAKNDAILRKALRKAQMAIARHIKKRVPISGSFTAGRYEEKHINLSVT